MKTKVLFIWKPRPELKKYIEKGLEHRQDVDLIFPVNAIEEEFLKYAPEASIMIGWRPSEKLLVAAKKLRLFINPGAGIKECIGFPVRLQITAEQSRVSMQVQPRVCQGYRS